MKRVFLYAPALIAALVLPNVPAIPASAGDAPVPLRGAVKTLAAERHGFIAYHRHLNSDRKAPGNDEVVVTESGRVEQDGHTIAARLYSRTSGGVAANAEDLAKRQAAIDGALPSNEHGLPDTEKVLADYRYGAPSACSGCARGVVAIAFTSLKRDDSHADGTVYVDENTRHILRFESKPSALPKEADFGEVTITFGQVTPDLWDIVSIKQHFGGARMGVHWSYDTAATHSAYRRFASADEARSKLAAGV